MSSITPSSRSVLPTSSTARSQSAWLWGVLVLILVLNAAFLYFNSFRLMKFFDMGTFIDLAWRVYQGQRPHIDYSIHVGPVNAYWMALFFHIFKFGKVAIWACTVATHSLAMLASFLLLKNRVPAWAVLLGTLVTTTSFIWAVSFPFYTHNAQLWGILATALLAAQVPFKTPRSVVWSLGTCGVASVIIFLTKSNVGAGFFMLFLAFALFIPQRKIALPSFVVGILLGLLIATLFWIPDWSRFANQTILQYGQSQQGRLFKLIFEPYHWFMNFYWVGILLVTVHLIRSKIFPKELCFLFLGVYGVAILETATSGAIWQCNTPLLGLFVTLVWMLLYSGTARGTRQATGSVSQEKSRLRRVILFGAAFYSLFLIALHAQYGLQVKGWTLPDRFVYGVGVNPMGTYALQTPSLQGWKTERGQGMAVDNLASFIQTHIPKEERLIILTDLFILNAMTGRESLRGIPATWTIDYLPPPGKALEEFQAFFNADPPEWIITHQKRVAFITPLVPYLGIQQTIQSHYAIVHQAGNYIVLRKKSTTDR